MKITIEVVLVACVLANGTLAQNLIRNPGFEDGTTSWQSYSDWAPMTTTTNFPHSGLRAALVYNRPNTYAGPSQSLLGRIQPGVTYVCSGWTRVERGNNQPTKLSMRQIDVDGSGRQRTQWHGLAFGVAYSNQWTFISGTFTLNVVGTLTDLTLYFEEPAAGVDYLVDDVSVTLLWPPPPAPTEIVTRAGDRSVVLHWKRAAVERPLAGYHVARSLAPEGPFLRLTTSPVALQSFADVSVTNAMTYFYCISAVDELGQESTNSAPVSATPQLFSSDEQFLDYLQQTAVDYFWYEANPINGLVRERSRSNAVASIAATGFGLTALGIGIEHGWLRPEQGRERALTTLRTLWEKPQGPGTTGTIGNNGWFYKSLDFDTALRNGTAEVASMDNALLLAGVLHTKEYFNGDNTVDAEIRALAEEIFNRVGWAWMTFGSHTVAQSWRPEAGFTLTNWGDYSEAMLLYLLGLGASNGLSSGSWRAWTNGYQWQTNYGYGYLACPPLSGHQQPQCWLDLRHIADGYMNAQGSSYFENSRRAVLAQRAYAIGNPGGWAGYGAWLWGFSGCDGPGTTGYTLHGAPPPQNEDGTVAPGAVAGALPFAPEYALPTLRRLYEKFRGSLWTGYGFGDAFNLHTNWWDAEVVGVDQGALLLLIENYRTQGIWRRCLQSPEIQRGLQTAGFLPLQFVHPRISRAPVSGDLVLSWDSRRGENYQMEYSTDLNLWRPLPGGFVTADGDSLNWTGLGAPASNGLAHCFYRVFMLRVP